jgi:methionyl-tRNA formyltransferase
MTFVFMGAPDFSTIVLDHLEAAGRRPALVVTQPDRPCGRGQRTRPTPVARWADARSIPVFKPTSCRDAGLRAALEQVAPDVIVTAAFGQILPKALLEMPKVGCLNVHASLLPKYRGASPIQAVLLNGESETGVTLMQMDEGLDTGPHRRQGGRRFGRCHRRRRTARPFGACRRGAPRRPDGRLCARRRDADPRRTRRARP